MTPWDAVSEVVVLVGLAGGQAVDVCLWKSVASTRDGRPGRCDLAMTSGTDRRGDKRRLRLAIVVVLAGVLATLAVIMVSRDAAGSTRRHDQAPTPSQSSVGPSSSRSTDGLVLLALGDSVPAGKACGCAPFPRTYGALLSRRTGVPVTVGNGAVSGLDTAGLLTQLAEPQTAAAVRGADVLLVTIGANDFGDHHDDVVSGRCEAANADCVRDELATLRANLTAVLLKIRTLSGDRHASVLVTGYWNVFEDGDVARRAVGDAGLQASLDLTRRANTVIAGVSSAGGARYVDLFRPFELAGRDVTSLLSADGDHPSAAGHALIPRALIDAGPPELV
jgi:lysophospholipase L1-like esterase